MCKLENVETKKSDSRWFAVNRGNGIFSMFKLLSHTKTTTNYFQVY